MNASPTHELGAALRREVLDPMKAVFVGKDEVIDLMGIALVAGENLFLLGPPGTAKSALVFELGRRLHGRTFEYLLTRFTEPNELFGPFDIRRLREGELSTNTEGMLPEADLVFLDELLNANSAILNALLTVLNERVFRRGRERRDLPMLMAVGASNHLPEEDALAALFDRFLLRVRCDNVPDEGLAAVLSAGWKLDLDLHEREGGLSVDDVRALTRALSTVDLGQAREAYVELVLRLRHAGIPLSDRRAVKLQKPIAASALLAGRQHALPADLWVLRYVWENEEQREVLVELVEESLRDHPTEEALHPRARGAEAPDPELLARDLARIEQRLAEGEPRPSDLAWLRDRLAVLSSRSAWVEDAAARSQLEQRVQQLAQSVGGLER